MDNIKKICYKCNNELPLTHFEFRKDTNKYRNQCRRCHKGYNVLLSEKQAEIQRLFNEGLKVCGRCNEIKTLDNYNVDNSTKTKVTSFCKECLRIKGEIYRKTDEAKIVLWKSRYNVSDEDILHFKNTNNCEICGKELSDKNKHLDHNHSTNKYRGALCRLCNIGLGQFFDDVDILQNAINYLNK